jgi:hypothetical protein
MFKLLKLASLKFIVPMVLVIGGTLWFTINGWFNAYQKQQIAERQNTILISAADERNKAFVRLTADYKKLTDEADGEVEATMQAPADDCLDRDYTGYFDGLQDDTGSSD